jgi:mono/diheme cytochrome c family protein
MGRALAAVVLAAALAVALVACGGETAGDTTGGTPAPVASETQATPSETSVPGGPSTEEVAALFADNCGSCHGADGGGGTGPDIRGEDDLAGVRSQIESGGGAMPGFSSRLQPGQIEALAQFVVTEL